MNDVITIAERLGIPVLVVVGVFALLREAIRAGGPAALALAKEGATFLSNLTASLNRTHVEHGELKAHVAEQVGGLREHVSRTEATLTGEIRGLREHVTAETGRVRDRVSAAENALDDAIDGLPQRIPTGQVPAVRGATPEVRPAVGA